ncbi:hypothetical protein [Bacillus cereus group sp. TH152-1LC]|uniref:hypothetical protein n=1 Tax=Bacillus cereus group sp. TH152-1LC TaxID=3018060 RepID=UPI0022E05ABC|nr:hypothetical protein [Bacillus cereus group sp. TH152-1LC]MDA1675541.1 hypothetical protein [Bacillus cereus group sp. TH152-1LC]
MNQKTKERLQKEAKVMQIFEELFLKTKEPVTLKGLIAFGENRLKEVYPLNMISSVLTRMKKDKKIQRVYLKEGKSNSYLFVPLHFQVDHETRDWETEEEKELRRISFLKNIDKLDESAFHYYLDMIAAPESKRRHGRMRMPIYKALENKNADYIKFISIIEPFLPYLEEKERYVISERLGIHTNSPRTFQEIGESLQLGYARCNEIFSLGLYSIQTMMRDKLKIDQYFENASKTPVLSIV